MCRHSPSRPALQARPTTTTLCQRRRPAGSWEWWGNNNLIVKPESYFQVPTMSFTYLSNPQILCLYNHQNHMPRPVPTKNPLWLLTLVNSFSHSQLNFEEDLNYNAIKGLLLSTDCLVTFILSYCRCSPPSWCAGRPSSSWTLWRASALMPPSPTLCLRWLSGWVSDVTRICGGQLWLLSSYRHIFGSDRSSRNASLQKIFRLVQVYQALSIFVYLDLCFKLFSLSTLS